MEIQSGRREIRYGIPAADQVVFKRHYVLGYSYYFRQAKWALEIIDSSHMRAKRADNFRTDYRIPEMFRADLVDYKGSGYDRGHLVASADQQEFELQNSETFLLSNMCPQVHKFNSGIWAQLENAVRDLDARPEILETYVISGPIFYFDVATTFIGTGDDNCISLPIPNAFFKSVLTENKEGDLDMWSFIIPNEPRKNPLESFLVSTKRIEQYAGINIWSNLQRSFIENKKRIQKSRIWE